MDEQTEKWLAMSNYDLETAQAMFRTRHYVYCIFMCHLALEKALKGLYWELKRQFPPKTHNLIFFAKELSLKMPQHLLDFLGKINDASVVTRYPEDLGRVIKAYPRRIAKAYLQQTEEVLQWIKTSLQTS